LSRPTITATLADPASDAVDDSIGCTVLTARECATPSASALWPWVYCTTVTWLAPGGRPFRAVACV